MRKKEAQKRKLTGNMKKKLAGLFAIILLALVGLVGCITYINAKSGDKYTKQVLTQSQQQYESTKIPFKRGDILDRNGNMLATSVKVYNVILDCKAVNLKEEYAEPTKQALSEYLGIDAAAVDTLLTAEETKESQYQILKKQISMDEKKNFEKMTEINEDEELSKEEKEKRNNIQGIWFEEDYKRSYPLNSLACDTIGFTYSGNSADWGLEGYYSNTLNGSDGKKYGYFSSDATLEQNIIDPVNGKNLTTTLDVNVQQVVEKYIAAYDKALSNGPNRKTGAANVGVVVQNPNNGEILGMASNSPYDLNNPRDLTGIYSEEEIKAMNDAQMEEAMFSMWRNYCITDAYEPGSVVKPIIVAGALDSGSISVSDTYDCDGGEQIGTEYIRCAVWPDAHGRETVGEVIQNSCNDAMMAIGKKMGVDTMLKYQQRFNFGTKTGIDLPGEGTGILFTKDTMNSTELATNTFGQSFTCTMIQEISAISSAINGGTYYQPHLLKEVKDENGTVLNKVEPVVMKEEISPEISADIREYMGLSVESGTSKRAKVNGYSMGGKTGTAEKLPRGNGNYLVSYVGFAPLDNPQVVIYVVVDEPNTEAQANSVYPQYIAQAVFSEIFPYLNIYPDEESDEETTLWEGFTGAGKTTEGTETVDNESVPAPPADTSGEEVQATNELSDGITNEAAGFEQTE